MNKYEELVNLNNKIQKLVNEKEEDISWDLKFDLIFCEEVSRRVYALLDELGTKLEYYDPDTSYEEDVRAFANALEQKMEVLKKINYMFE